MILKDQNPKKLNRIQEKESKPRQVVQKVKNVICILNQGIFFGHEDIIKNQKREFTVTAFSDKVELLRISRELYQNLDLKEIKDIFSNFANT